MRSDMRPQGGSSQSLPETHPTGEASRCTQRPALDAFRYDDVKRGLRLNALCVHQDPLHLGCKSQYIDEIGEMIGRDPEP